MAVQNNGFLLIDEGSPEHGNTTRRIPLMRNGEQMRTRYCAFRRADNSGCYIEEFADLLREEFER